MKYYGILNIIQHFAITFVNINYLTWTIDEKYFQIIYKSLLMSISNVCIW